jgi:structural maintenance of chromosome 2
VQFDYQIPPQAPNAQDFPHNQIYGRMSRLFTVVDVAKYGVAIQTIAGARLRHVVVQQHTVSRDLLQYKATRGQESFIPLNKAQWRVADAATVQKMKALTHGKVELALDLLKFDARFHPALA